jgi:hypothetical protein
MKTLSLIHTVFLLGLITCFAQNNVKERVETINEFVRDLRGETSNRDLFNKHLQSRGIFDNEKIEQAANGWTDMLRKSLKASTADEVEIYKYSYRPEKGRKLKAVDDPDSDAIEYVPLEFELRSKNDTVSNVDMDDLYVIRIRDEKVFVLFDRTNKMITWFGLKWGHKIELTEF